MKKITFLIAILVVITLACDFSQIGLITEPSFSEDENALNMNTGMPAVEITFRARIPPGTPPDEPIMIKFMEEVTGLALSAKSYEMTQENNLYYAFTQSFPVGSVVKYRYSRKSSIAEIQEHVSDGRQVRYRLFHTANTSVADDVISRWTDTSFNEATGRIQGQITDSSNGKPVPNLLITGAGAQTLSASDGSFLLEGLPEGIHNIVVYSMDGKYNIFQQGARVAADSTTPAQIFVTPNKMVEITFFVTMPPNTIPAVPIKIVGNLTQFGNSYADLKGGVNTISARSPQLALLPDGRLTYTAQLPSGVDFHYLYTMGDGLWNTELNQNGEPNLRQLIIPDEPTQINDNVSSWISSNSAPITFDVTTPANTPPGDYISIQFRPIFGWTEPIKMWRLGDNRWVYVLNSPLKYVNNTSYRFCRNDQCGIGDAIDTKGYNSSGYPLSSSLFRQKIVEEIKEWVDINVDSNAIQVTTPSITPRNQNFWAGVEFSAGYHPSWSALFPNILDEIRRIGANSIIFTPTWTFSRQNPPILEIQAGKDPFWSDITNDLTLASEQGFQIAIKPTAQFPMPTKQWYITANRDYSWWQVWFERYRNFALHHADLAAQVGAQMLILGGDWVTPALPSGMLADNSASGVPEDATARWILLISEIKNHYGGPLFWSVSYDQIINSPPPFLNYVDGIYLDWSSVPLTPQDNEFYQPIELDKEANRLFDNAMIPFLAKYNKPIFLAVSYPSASGARTGCLRLSDGNCLEPEYLSPGNPDYPDIVIDLQEQVDLYNAMLSVFYQRNWISGFISRGYYPPLILKDKSNSIHGKPSEELLAYWFLNLYPVSSP